MPGEENPTSFSIEFDEILDDLKRVEGSKEPFFQAAFVDQYPSWRKLRYLIALHHIKQSTIELDTQQRLTASLEKIKENPENSYIAFVKVLRKLHENEPLSSLNQEMCYRFYTSIHMHHFCKKVVQLFKKSVKIEPIEEDLFTRLTLTRKQITKAPRSIKIPFAHSIWQFIVGQFNLNYDPQVQENTPYILFEMIGKDKNIQVIRMGTQTYEGYFSLFSQTANVNKEFEGFVNYLLANKKKHIYFNFQNKIPTWYGRNEAPRCRALEEFASKYQECLYFVTLPKNTLFYHQEGPFEALDDAKIFKENFIIESKNLDGGFSFINIEELITSDKIINKIIDEVHLKHFDNKPQLSLEERKNFIELTYLELEKWLIIHINPDSINLTCKDGIDRAGGASALLYFDLYLKHLKELNESQIQDLEAILFAPALLVKKRAITKNRFDRFISAAKHLSRIPL
jgi:hypothetical protein